MTISKSWSGNNTISCNAGNNSVDLLRGTNVIYGGAGDDVFDISGDAGEPYGNGTISGGDGFDTLVARGEFFQDYSIRGIECLTTDEGVSLKIEQVLQFEKITRVGDNYAPAITLLDGGGVDLGSRTPNGIYVRASEIGNSIKTGNAADILFGNIDNDTLSAGGGRDTIYFSDGTDVLNGGAGNDLFWYQDYSYTPLVGKIHGGVGSDTLELAIDDVTIGGGLSDVEVLRISPEGKCSIRVSTLMSFSRVVSYSDYIGDNRPDVVLLDAGAVDLSDKAPAGIKIFASEFGNRIAASTLNDIVGGATGNDTIIGNAGNDIISGGSGEDYLSGGLGDDTISVLTGNDVVFGNAGADFCQWRRRRRHYIRRGWILTSFCMNRTSESQGNSGQDSIVDFARLAQPLAKCLAN